MIKDGSNYSKKFIPLNSLADDQHFQNTKHLIVQVKENEFDTTSLQHLIDNFELTDESSLKSFEDFPQDQYSSTEITNSYNNLNTAYPT